jgi:hypothetical protein
LVGRLNGGYRAQEKCNQSHYHQRFYTDIVHFSEGNLPKNRPFLRSFHDVFHENHETTYFRKEVHCLKG